ncbi:aminoglycoside phosphotransferase family protein [Cellulomonas sp.]|uniref:phosphotransferase family protein n=1 Tax=Cellulomonas sp. TaxID=40001 RepID=UPI0025903F65|nr:aminoglycoside phosphotransferase family protein [Cellulomonas sp.]MCR6688410.1 aminoglycoside phosphotransferase family protein [Cellulomonas sp.]
MPDDAAPDLPLDALTRLVAPLGTLADATRLEGGLFATTYRVTLEDGTRVVVKTAPVATGRLLTHEHDLLRTEAEVYALGADHPDLLLPRLLHQDFTRTVVGGDVVVAAHLDGVPWKDAGFGPADRDPRAARAHGDLAALIGRFAAVAGTTFGYPQSPALQADTWRGALTAMVEALLSDAQRWSVDVPADRIRTALDRHGAALDEVTEPRLVHSDLWPGNLFVDPATGAITGVIDPERALWGDPLVDVVGADPMWDGPGLDLDDSFDLTSPSGAARLLLARLWLALVMTVEIAPRAYTGDWVADYDAANRRNLARALDELGV